MFPSGQRWLDSVIIDEQVEARSISKTLAQIGMTESSIDVGDPVRSRLQQQLLVWTARLHSVIRRAVRKHQSGFHWITYDGYLVCCRLLDSNDLIFSVHESEDGDRNDNPIREAMYLTFGEWVTWYVSNTREVPYSIGGGGA